MSETQNIEYKPEEFIDKKTGSPKYWNNSEEKEKEKNDPVKDVFDPVKQKNDTVKTENDPVKNIFDPVNLENERVKDVFERVNIKNERVKDIFERVNTENERVKDDLMQIYSFIEQNPLVKISSIEKFNKKSNATNRRYLKILKDNNLIEYVGSDKTGGYKIVINT